MKNYLDEDYSPIKIHVCTCKQCKAVKNKRKNRKSVKKTKRLLNKKRRKLSGKIICYMWA